MLAAEHIDDAVAAFLSCLPSTEDGIGQILPRGSLDDSTDIQQYHDFLASFMVHIANLLDEFQLRGVEVEVGNLAVEELTRDTSNGDERHIADLGLRSKFLCREEFLSREGSRQDACQYNGLRVFLSHLLESLLLSLLLIGDILLVSRLQLVGNGIATILQTVE